MTAQADKRNMRAELPTQTAVKQSARRADIETAELCKARERGVDRLVALLAHLHHVGHAVRVGELARTLGAPRSTIYALVKTLIGAGLLEPVGQSGEVFFGKTAYFYGMDYLREHDLFARARAEVDRLARETEETTQFCVMQDRKYTVAYMSSGSKPFRVSSEIGTRIPLPWTASGRLLLADMDESEIRSFLKPADLHPPRHSPVPIDAFLQSIANAKRDGFCITTGLVDPFTHCIAAPIWDRLGRVTATVCLVVLVDSTPERIDSLRQTLVASARSLSLAPLSSLSRRSELAL